MLVDGVDREIALQQPDDQEVRAPALLVEARGFGWFEIAFDLAHAIDQDPHQVAMRPAGVARARQVERGRRVQVEEHRGRQRDLQQPGHALPIDVQLAPPQLVAVADAAGLLAEVRPNRGARALATLRSAAPRRRSTPPPCRRRDSARPVPGRAR